MSSPKPVLENGNEGSDLKERYETLQRRLEQLERTFAAVAQQTAGVRLAGPCSECERGLLLVTADTIVCPVCQYRRSL